MIKKMTKVIKNNQESVPLEAVHIQVKIYI